MSLIRTTNEYAFDIWLEIYHQELTEIIVRQFAEDD